MDKGIETNDKKRLIRRTSNCSGKRARFVTGRRTSVRIAKHSGTKRSLPPGNHLPASQLSRHQPVANPTKKKFATKMMKSAGKKIRRLLNKGAKYLGIAIIKVFNQPGLYGPDSRICVV